MYDGPSNGTQAISKGAVGGALREDYGARATLAASTRDSVAGAIPRALEGVAMTQVEIQKLLAHLFERLEPVLTPGQPEGPSNRPDTPPYEQSAHILAATNQGARLLEAIRTNAAIIQQLRSLHERLAL